MFLFCCDFSYIYLELNIFISLVPFISIPNNCSEKVWLKCVMVSLQTNDELGQTTDRCNRVTDKSVEAHEKAEQERHAVKGDLDNVRDDLNSIRLVLVYLYDSTLV